MLDTEVEEVEMQSTKKHPTPSFATCFIVAHKRQRAFEQNYHSLTCVIGSP